MNRIGILKFKKFEENVVIDETFSIDDLYRIMDCDPDFVSFSIPGELYLNGTVTFKKHQEIIGTTYNVFSKVQYRHKYKTTYKISTGGYCLTKDKAEKIVESQNKKQRLILNNFKREALDRDRIKS